jgi:diacylglycerol O-acyltransferase / wax synthase
MWVLEDVAGTTAGEGDRLIVMTKVHHAAVDGVTGASLLAQLCSVEPDPPPPEPVDGPSDASALEIAAGGLVKFVSRPLRLANVLPSTVSTVVKDDSPGQQWPRDGRTVRGAADTVQRSLDRAAQHRIR